MTEDAPIYLGIDLAWSPHRPSGLCWLFPDGRARLEHRIVDATWVEDGLNGLPAVVAVDAPIVLAPARTAEWAVARAYAKKRCACHTANCLRERGLNAGEVLRSGLAGFSDAWTDRMQADRWIFETYPHVCLIEWMGLDSPLPYKAKPGRDRATRDAAFARLQEFLIDRLHPWKVDLGPRLHQSASALRGQALKRHEDELDAMICAAMALELRMRPVARLGEEASGFMVVPDGAERIIEATRPGPK